MNPIIYLPIFSYEALILISNANQSIQMNPYANFFLLGVIQGLTEFLPISSSGHLVLLENILGFNPQGVVIEVALHLATLFAVVIFYFRDIKSLLLLRKGKTINKPKAYLTRLLFVTLITSIVVYPFRNALASMTEDSLALFRIGVAFLVTALMLVTTDTLLRRNGLRFEEVTYLGYMALALIGVVQAVAAIPGISRSGSTIFAGILCGLSREEAARFSFFMFIPIALIASIYELINEATGLTFPSELWLPLGVGFLASLLTGIFAIGLLLRLIKSARLSYFSLYLIVASIVAFIFA